MSAQGIASRYAKALFDLSKDRLDEAKKRLDQLQPVVELFAIDDSEKILRSPVMPDDLKKELVDYALGKSEADKDLRNFVHSVIDAGRAPLLPGIVDHYKTLILDAEGIVQADVTTAVELEDNDKEAIAQILGDRLGKKVQIRPDIDPGILGGFVARIGNYRVDLSLKTKLEGLAQSAVQ